MIQVSFNFLAMAKYLYVLQSEYNEKFNLFFILFPSIRFSPLLIRGDSATGARSQSFLVIMSSSNRVHRKMTYLNTLG